MLLVQPLRPLSAGPPARLAVVLISRVVFRSSDTEIFPVAWEQGPDEGVPRVGKAVDVDVERARLMSLARNLSDTEHLQQVRRPALKRSPVARLWLACGAPIRLMSTVD